MSDNMEYTVQTEPDGRQYQVTAVINGDSAVIHCDCLAGKTGQICKHRRALLDGDESLIVSSASHTVDHLRAAIVPTALGRSLERLRYSEELMARAQQLNTDEKVRFAHLMNAELEVESAHDELERQLESQLESQLLEDEH